MRTVVLLLSAFIILSGCEHADPLDSDGIEPTLESIQANIFNTSCAISGCHAGANAAMRLDLSEGAARANLVGVESREVPDLLRVDPGNPDDSYLVIKIEGTDPRLTGSRMPLNGQPLSADKIAVVREWIAGGAE